MSNEYIKVDPLGKGVQRVIGDRALTESISDDRIKILSENGGAFVNYVKHDISAGSVYEPLCIFKNTGIYQIHIKGILLNCNDTNGAVELFTDSIITSGGVEKKSLNMNRSSTHDSHSECFDNSLNDLVVSNGTNEFFHISVSVGQPIWIDLFSALILGVNNTLFLQCKHASVTTSFRAMIVFFEEDKVIGSHSGVTS